VSRLALRIRERAVSEDTNGEGGICGCHGALKAVFQEEKGLDIRGGIVVLLALKSLKGNGD
jgi:hypothetical protein